MFVLVKPRKMKNASKNTVTHFQFMNGCTTTDASLYLDCNRMDIIGKVSINFEGTQSRSD